MLPTLRFAVCLNVLVVAGCGLDLTARPDGERGTGTFQTPWGIVELDYEWRNGQRVHDGDMVLEPSAEVGALEVGKVAQPLLSSTGLKWSMNAASKQVRIPYVIEADGVGSAVFAETSARIRRAMDHWEKHVLKPDGTRLLDFVPHQNEGRFARFVVKPNGGVCEVFLSGAGIEKVKSDPACRWQTYVHEIGHLLTFRHEQRRQDRPAHVRFHEDRTSADGQFKPTGGSYLGTDYDTRSIMHYPSCMFASAAHCGPGTPNAWVLERKYGNPYIKWWSERSVSEVLSAADICGTQTLYGIRCSGSAAAEAFVESEPDGVVDNETSSEAVAAEPEELTGVGCSATGQLAASWLALLGAAALRRRRVV